MTICKHTGNDQNVSLKIKPSRGTNDGLDELEPNQIKIVSVLPVFWSFLPGNLLFMGRYFFVFSLEGDSVAISAWAET